MFDLHSHSTISDGKLNPTEVVEAAKAAGVRVLALTDHDTLDGIPEARRAAERVGIELVPGVEISCRHEGDSVHVLGLFVNPDDDELHQFFAGLAENRQRRIELICERLTAIGLPLEVEEVRRQHRGSTIGRPHVADAMVARGYVATRREAFDRFLAAGKPGNVVFGRRVAVSDAVARIHRAGGVSSLAHPRYLKDQAGIPDLIRESGMRAIEVHHADHTAEERETYEAIADSIGALVTGGSDFHYRGGEGGQEFGSLLSESRYEEVRAAAGG